jgi:hypothetical protein
MFCLDRSDDRRAGGVSLFTSLFIVAKQRFDLEQNGLEIIWVEMQINRLFFVCGVCYRLPNSNQASNITLLDYLQSCLDQIYLKTNTHVLLLGDFNAHYDIENHVDGSNFCITLYRWMECNNLYQIINEVMAYCASLLDLIITTSTGVFVDSSIASPPSNCDHSFIFARMNISLAKPRCYKRFIWDLPKINEENLVNALNCIHWDYMFLMMLM